MSLRSKLLVAAAGIAIISLFLSAAVTWVLVRNLQLDSAREQLANSVGLFRNNILNQQCPEPGIRVCGPDDLAPAATYQDRLNRLAQNLPQDTRLLLVDRSGIIVYDSLGNQSAGQELRLGAPRTVGRLQVREGDLSLGGETFVWSAAPLPAGRDPLGAAYVVLARSNIAVTAAAVSELLPRLLLAGLIALAVALLTALLLSRTVARRLAELARASEDIAGGNYAARVAIGGSDEIGVLGSSFNHMAEAVERARTAQRDFIANVSHELKTPLTSLIGFSQALFDGSLPSDREKTRAAVVLHEEAQRVLRLAQELLDLARVEGGQLSLNLQPVDLESLIRQEIEIARQRATERRLEFDVQMPAALPPVLADPERLHQIFDNLLDNALKYAPEGTEVRVLAQAQDGHVETQISNPLPTPRPDPQRMFERFYRADASRSSAQGGVGLGLAISRELAMVQHGQLWADVDGSDRLRLWLTLPVAEIG